MQTGGIVNIEGTNVYLQSTEFLSLVKNLMIKEYAGPATHTDLNRWTTAIGRYTVERGLLACPALRFLTLQVESWEARKESFCKILDDDLSRIFKQTFDELRSRWYESRGCWGRLYWDFVPVPNGCRCSSTGTKCSACFHGWFRHERLKEIAEGLRNTENFLDHVPPDWY